VKVVFVKKVGFYFPVAIIGKKKRKGTKKKLERYKIEAKPSKEEKKEENKTNRKHREGKHGPLPQNYLKTLKGNAFLFPYIFTRSFRNE